MGRYKNTLRDELIREKRKEGSTVESLAEEFDLSPQRINHICIGIRKIHKEKYHHLHDVQSLQDEIEKAKAERNKAPPFKRGRLAWE